MTIATNKIIYLELSPPTFKEEAIEVETRKGQGPGGSWRYIAGELYRGSYRSRDPERTGPKRQLAVHSRRALQRKL